MYLEFYSTPPFSGPGSAGPDDTELEIRFSATPVPEPGTAVLMSGCFAVLNIGAALTYVHVLCNSESRLQSEYLYKADPDGRPGRAFLST